MVTVRMEGDSFLLERGNIVMLDGDCGAGKTTLALWLAHQITETTGANVLFLDGESDMQTLRWRLGDLRVPETKVWFATRFRVEQADREKALKKMTRRCKRLGIAVVIFDALHSCFPVNTASDEIETLKMIHQFAMQADIPVIVTANLRDFEIDPDKVKALKYVHVYKVWREPEQDDEEDDDLTRWDGRVSDSCIHFRYRARKR